MHPNLNGTFQLHSANAVHPPWRNAVSSSLYPYSHYQNAPHRLVTDHLALSRSTHTPSSHNDLDTSVHDTIEWLLSPPIFPLRQHSVATIGLPWVYNVVGNELVFDGSPGVNRLVLSKDSETRRIGQHLGLPTEYYRWLCGIGEQAGINEFKIPIIRLTDALEVARNLRSAKARGGTQH